jgi:excisionase family DNA binding protein
MDMQNTSQDNLVKQASPKKINGVSIDNLPDLLTVAEVADLLRVSKLTIKRWGKRGKLPAIRINARGDRRYRKEAVLWLLGIQSE